MRFIIALALIATALVGVCGVPVQNHVLQPMIVDSPLNFVEILAPNDAPAGAVNPPPAPEAAPAAPAAPAATPAPPAPPAATPAVPVTPLAGNVAGAAAGSPAAPKATPSGPGSPQLATPKKPEITENKHLIGGGDPENQLTSPPPSDENKGPNQLVKPITIAYKKDGEHLPLATNFGEAPATTLTDKQVDVVARNVIKGARDAKCNGKAPYCDLHLSHKPAPKDKKPEGAQPKKEAPEPKKEATPKPEAEKPEPKKEAPAKPAPANGKKPAETANLLAKADELLAKANEAATKAVEKVTGAKPAEEENKEAPAENKEAPAESK